MKTTTAKAKARNGKARNAPPAAPKKAPPVKVDAQQWMPATDPAAAILRPGLPCMLRIRTSQINDDYDWGQILSVSSVGDTAQVATYENGIVHTLVETMEVPPKGGAIDKATPTPAAEPQLIALVPGMILSETENDFGPSVLLRIQNNGDGILVNGGGHWYTADSNEMRKFGEDAKALPFFAKIADRLLSIVASEPEGSLQAPPAWVDQDFKAALCVAMDATAAAVNAINRAYCIEPDHEDAEELGGVWTEVSSAFDGLCEITGNYLAGASEHCRFDTTPSAAFAGVRRTNCKPAEKDPYHAALVSVNQIQARTAKAIESRWYGKDDELYSMVDELGDQFSDIERTLSYVSRAYLGMTAGEDLHADHEPAAYDSPAERLAGKLWAIVERGRKTGLVGLDADADTGKVFDALEEASSAIFNSIKKTRPPQAMAMKGGGQ